MERVMMTRVTIADAIKMTGTDVLDHLDRQLDIPVVAGRPQCQGDVAVIPIWMTGNQVASATQPVPMSGIAVVRSESGGNTHSLHTETGAVVCFDSRGAHVVNLALGVLTVGEGSVALLAHPEHGFNRIGPGTYELRRQREQADEIRMVAD